MARTVLAIRIEGELLADAAHSVVHIHEALTHRHGDQFRALERDVEALIDGRTPLSRPRLQQLGEADDGATILVVQPCRELTDLIARARALGVI